MGVGILLAVIMTHVEDGYVGLRGHGGVVVVKSNIPRHWVIDIHPHDIRGSDVLYVIDMSG